MYQVTRLKLTEFFISEDFYRTQKIILSILILGTLMGALDSTIVILAFLTISSSFHSEMLTALWIILAYLLAVAVCTTQLWRIGDIWTESDV